MPPERTPQTVVLAFDCSAAFCAAAVGSGSDLRAQRSVEMPRRSDGLLIPHLESTLAEAGLAWPDVQRIAVGVGPGNFTGIRMAVAAARGLALALGVRAIGVGRLEALAEGHALPVLASAAARRGSVHLQLFGAEGWERPRQYEPEALASLELPAGTGLVGPVGAVLTDYPCLAEGDMPNPAVMAQIALRAPQRGRPAPIYPRPPNADLPAEPPPTLLP